MATRGAGGAVKMQTEGPCLHKAIQKLLKVLSAIGQQLLTEMSYVLVVVTKCQPIEPIPVMPQLLCWVREDPCRGSMSGGVQAK